MSVQTFDKKILIIPVRDTIIHEANFRDIKEDHVQNLVASMSQKGWDPDHPAYVVRSKNDPTKWEVTAGKHRREAAIRVGIDSMFAIDKTHQPEMDTCFEVARSNQANPFTLLDIARHFTYMSEKYGITQTEYAKEIGCTQSYVSQALPLLELAADPEVGPYVDHIAPTTLLAISKHPDYEPKIDLCRRAIEGNLSVRQAQQDVALAKKSKEFDQQFERATTPSEIPAEPWQDVHFRVPVSTLTIVRQAIQRAGDGTEFEGNWGMCLAAISQFFIDHYVADIDEEALNG